MDEIDRARKLIARLRDASERSGDVPEAASLQQQAQTALLLAILDEVVGLRADLARRAADTQVPAERSALEDGSAADD